MVTRVNKAVRKLISTNQFAFVSNRQIIDGVLVINELMNLFRRQKKKYMLFKANFEKMHDYVS